MIKDGSKTLFHCWDIPTCLSTSEKQSNFVFSQALMLFAPLLVHMYVHTRLTT